MGDITFDCVTRMTGDVAGAQDGGEKGYYICKQNFLYRDYCLKRHERSAIVEFVEQHLHYVHGASFCM